MTRGMEMTFELNNNNNDDDNNVDLAILGGLQTAGAAQRSLVRNGIQVTITISKLHTRLTRGHKE